MDGHSLKAADAIAATYADEKQLLEKNHRIEHLQFELNFANRSLEKAEAEKLAAVHESENKLRLQYRDDKLTSYQEGMEAAMKLMEY